MKLVLPLLTVCAFSLACTSKSPTAPTTQSLTTSTVESASKPESKDIRITSGAVEWGDGSVFITVFTLSGTSGLEMHGSSFGDSTSCTGQQVNCSPGDTIDLGGSWGAEGSTLRLKGHDYGLGGIGMHAASAQYKVAGSVIAPPFRDSHTAEVSAPFTFSGTLYVPQFKHGDEGASTIDKYDLSGSGTATLTLTRYVDTEGIPGNFWWVTHATYTFQRANAH